MPSRVTFTAVQRVTGADAATWPDTRPAPRRRAESGRPRWPWVTLTVALLALVVGTAALWVHDRNQPSPPRCYANGFLDRGQNGQPSTPQGAMTGFLSEVAEGGMPRSGYVRPTAREASELRLPTYTKMPCPTTSTTTPTANSTRPSSSTTSIRASGLSSMPSGYQAAADATPRADRLPQHRRSEWSRGAPTCRSALLPRRGPWAIPPCGQLTCMGRKVLGAIAWAISLLLLFVAGVLVVVTAMSMGGGSVFVPVLAGATLLCVLSAAAAWLGWHSWHGTSVKSSQSPSRSGS